MAQRKPTKGRPPCHLAFRKWPTHSQFPMDLICNSYANDSDDEPEPLTYEQQLASKRPYPNTEERQCKLPRRPNPPYGSYSNPQTSSAVSVPVPIPVPGRYVSKRERSLLASLSTVPNQNQGSDLIQKLPSTSPTGTCAYT